MTQRNQRYLGAAFWLAAVGAAATWMLAGHAQPGGADAAAEINASPASLIMDSLWSPTESIEVSDPTGALRVGDVAFSRQSDRWQEVGYITSVRQVDQSANRLTLSLFDRSVWTPAATLRVHRNSGRIGDVMETLLPPQKRERLQQKLAAAFEAHADAVASEILPLIVSSIGASVPLIEIGVEESIARHRAEIDTLVKRYREEIVREKLVPLVREEVMPIVRRHAAEPAEAIGREIWDKASLWRFGWRAVYDQTPLPERALVATEWSRFVDEEVTPILEAHLEEIATAVEEIAKEIAANENVRDELAETATTIASDPEARHLLRIILRESIVDNEQLRQAWTDVWSSPAAKERLRRAGERLEPILRETGDELMGTREHGIEPGFARVLRNQVLSKDRTWITITSGEGTAPAGEPVAMQRATEFMPYPVVYLAQ
ncbi:hypothetical protein [Allorhodopirellula solitaria]|uniref:SLA1 homology domain-containing protein n=1 Tax=Allorhodopirellula solitaria TaxID=2527987 RepID=A0A5C5X8R7_9BACT|nr:hypothetical protein [Allorhodopirellula solitaria]TWT59228.1 hypothetical protein CA85_39240 [Allorhodopirellula solitaria]